MTDIICEDFCDCGERYHKNYANIGDYYPTDIGMVLQRFCPECGKMKPFVKGKDEDYISNNQKKKVSLKIAREFDRGFIELKKMVKDIPTNNVYKFSAEFAHKVGIPQELILAYCS